MSDYFIHNGRQDGPYSVAELQARGLDPDTLVWKSGMIDWKRAAEVKELQALLLPAAGPPATKRTMPRLPSNRKAAPYGWLLWLGGTLVLAIAAYMLLYNKGSDNYSSASTTHAATVEPKKADSSRQSSAPDALAEERNRFAHYLLVDKPTWSRNGVGEIWLEGSLVNHARLAYYSKMVLKVTYYAADHRLLGQEQFTRYETCAPGGVVPFRYRSSAAPRETRQVDFEVVGAIASKGE